MKKTYLDDGLFNLMSIIATTLAIVIGGIIIYSTITGSPVPTKGPDTVVIQTVTENVPVG